jgi:hypothetical protein
MSLPGYQCQQCWGIFTDRRCGGDAQEGSLKCPTCQSEKVQKVDLPDDWVFQGFGALCFG